MYSPAMTDFVFMVKRSSFMFVTGPEVVKTVTKEEVSQEVLGGADTHTTVTGVAHGSFENDILALKSMRELFEYLPLSNRDKPAKKATADPTTRQEESLRYLVPDDPNMPYDMLDVVKKVVDENTIYEIMPHFATNVIVGFARMNGQTVGIVGESSLLCPTPSIYTSLDSSLVSICRIMSNNQLQETIQRI